MDIVVICVAALCRMVIWAGLLMLPAVAVAQPSAPGAAASTADSSGGASAATGSSATDSAQEEQAATAKSAVEGASTDRPSPGPSEPAVTFDQVQPMLKKRCGSCHGGSEPRGDLDVSGLDKIRAGSASGQVVVAGQPEQSLLYTLTAHLEDPKMPPGAPKIPQREIELLYRWIAGGLHDKPRAGDPLAARSATTTASVKPTMPAGAPAVGPRSTAVAVADGASPLPARVDVTPLSRPTAVTALAVDPTSARVAVSGQRQIVLCTLPDHQPLHAFPFPEGEVHDLTFSRDGRWLAAAGGLPGSQGVVVVIDVESGERILTLPEQKDAVLSVSLSEDRTWLAWGGPTRTVKLYRVPDHEVTATLTGPTDWVLSVAISPDGLLTAGCDRFGSVRIWETQTGKLFASLRGHLGAVTSAAWSPDSEQLVTAGEDGTARLWNLHTKDVVAVWNPGLGGLLDVEWHPSGLLALAGRLPGAALMNLQGQTLHQVKLNDEATSVAFSGDGQSLLITEADGSILPWQVATGELQPRWTLPIASSASHSRGLAARPARTRAAREPAAVATTATAASSPPGSGSPDEQLLQAVLDAEAAVRQTEESLAKLRASAAQLRHLLEQRQAAESLPKSVAPAK
jgi:hypothetical protein